MEVKLTDGREHFFQWDLNRSIIVEGCPNMTQAHFYSMGETCALAVTNIKKLDNGSFEIPVPNILLQKTFPIYLYVVCNDFTKEVAKINVVCRAKPADYIYTEKEVLKWEELAERIEDIEILFNNNAISNLEIDEIMEM